MRAGNMFIISLLVRFADNASMRPGRNAPEFPAREKQVAGSGRNIKLIIREAPLTRAERSINERLRCGKRPAERQLEPAFSPKSGGLMAAEFRCSRKATVRFPRCIGKPSFHTRNSGR